jgi:aspartate aminotransferase
MEAVSHRIAALAESQTMAMNQRTRDLQAQGVNVINMTVGEPDFNTPDHIKEAAKKAIDDNYSFYSPNPGYPELIQAVVNKFKRENNLEYAANQIIVSNGAKHSLANVMMCLINKGDEVLLPAPYWVSYYELVKLAEGTNVVLNTTVESNWKITPAQLEKAITTKTKALILCSPSNPTGSVYSQTEMEALVKVLEKHPQVYVIADEIYEHINFIGNHVSIAQFPSMKERSFIINGVSKGYAMTGWRIGYIGGPAWMAKACNKLQSQFTSNPNTIAQRASIAALNGDQSVVAKMCEAFKRRRDLVMKLVKEIPGLKVANPDGAFYIFPDASSYFGKSDGETTIKNSDDLCLYLLSKGHVACVAGSAFGNDNCFRISYANADEKLVEAMKRMKETFSRLK